MVALSCTPSLESIYEVNLRGSFDDMNEDTQAAYAEFKAGATRLETCDI